MRTATTNQRQRQKHKNLAHHQGRRRRAHHLVVALVASLVVLLLAFDSSSSISPLAVAAAAAAAATFDPQPSLQHPLQSNRQRRRLLDRRMRKRATTAARGGGTVPAAETTTTTTTTTSNNNETMTPSDQQQQQHQQQQHQQQQQTTNSNTSSNDNKSFLTRARETVFPIYGSTEIVKFLLIGSIKFFIILALTLTRDAKDTLVVTQCGAEAIAFLKIYGVLPAATAFIAVYSKLSNVVSKRALFYGTCIPFFVFFAFFDAVVYPLSATKLHPDLATVQSWLGVAPTDAGGGRVVLARILAHWTSGLFYIVAEIYSSVSVGLLFWQYANDVVPVPQAQRFYPLFAQMSGLAPVVAGQYAVRYASTAPDLGTSLHRLTLAVTLAGVMICVCYASAAAFVERTEQQQQQPPPSDGTTTAPVKKKKSSKPKLSMVESAKFLASSQYLRLVATLVLGYGLSINFTEIMWKSLVKKQYPDPLDYQRFMGHFSSVVGAATCLVIFFGVHVIRLLGWRVGALATPGIMAVVAVPFFACILWGTEGHPNRLRAAVVCGTVLSLLSKTSKYALFDPTTQMAYIPLDDESKVKGKAAIDVLGSRIGKSGGSLLQQGLVVAFGNIVAAAPVVAVIYYAVLLAWLRGANQLAGLFPAQTAVHQAEQQQQQQQHQEQPEADRTSSSTHIKKS